jgi:hypothetical protein
MNDLVFLTIITGRKKRDDIICMLADINAQTINSIYGRDCIKAGLLRSAFGLVPDDEEVLIDCIMEGSSVDFVMGELLEKFSFKKPKTGVAFAVKVDKISF